MKKELLFVVVAAVCVFAIALFMIGGAAAFFIFSHRFEHVSRFSLFRALSYMRTEFCRYIAQNCG